MEIRVLRYFLEVAREGNITRAAARLHISQPALSKQLKDLEKELGKKLFVRGNYNIHLTDEGTLLRKRAEDILNLVDKTTAEFQALDDITGGDIHIGCAESNDFKYIARCIKILREKYPGIRCHLYSGNTDDVTTRLDRGLLDFSVIVENVDLSKYNYIDMQTSDQWGLLMRKDSPLAAKEVICMEDLLNIPLICSRQGLEADYPKWFSEKVDSLHIAATYNLVYNAAIMVKEGIGYALSFDKLADTSSESELCFRPLSPALDTKMYIIWKKYQTFTKPAVKFLEVLKESLGLRETADETTEKDHTLSGQGYT